MGLGNIRVSGIQKEECYLNYLHMRETEKQKDREGGEQEANKLSSVRNVLSGNKVLIHVCTYCQDVFHKKRAKYQHSESPAMPRHTS